MMRKAVVIDLDHTFISVNSFQKYIIYIVRTAAIQGRIDICIALCKYVIMRKLRLITHEIMKKHILLVSDDFFRNKKSIFIEKLTKYTSPNILNIINCLKKEGYYTCLSSAAPASYVVPLAILYDFDGYIATPMVLDNNWHENSKENKCTNTLSYLSAHKAVLDIFVTDHYDDLPLLRIKKSSNYLVKPSVATIKKLLNEDINFVRI